MWYEICQTVISSAQAAEAQSRAIKALPPDERGPAMERLQELARQREEASRRQQQLTTSNGPGLLGAGIIGFILGMGAG